jgi:cytochrome P450
VDDADKKPLPPGRAGLPLLGETLSLIKNNYRYIDQRVAEHGAIFRARVLGRRAIFLAGPEATELFNDESIVQREGGMPDFVEQFFGGKSLPLIDGELHRTRKHQVLGAFSRKALESYVAPMQSVIERWLGDLARGGEFRAVDKFKAMALQIIGRTMLSLDPGPELDVVIENFSILNKGFGSLPIHLPGTTFSKALKARDKILEVLRAAVKRHREHDFGDGLSQMLAARAADGSGISDEHAVLELHHFNIAGYLIYTMMCTLLAELNKDPKILTRLSDEIDAKAPGKTGPLTVSQLANMPYLDCVVRETKRFTPFVTLFFGKAKRDFDWNGFHVPAGWTVLWSQHATNRWEKSFDDPNRFDPDRFSEARAEDKRHPHAYSPQGAGPIGKGHKCAGYDYSTILTQVFLVALVRGYRWELPKQNLDYKYEAVPPEHADGLRVILKPRP